MSDQDFGTFKLGLCSAYCMFVTITTQVYIFQDAKKDEAVKKAYKYLARLHEVW